ncbi:uncharacterized protein STEHIDRAFT_171174 [Stereum hirsutum FP-91666 SS1]|uniref:uncharacterized protein n=1 Tax=Stereum hirsutum (strain FP-91666) TaxID=721885 RepID=UPI0004449785|nr:uncharacterized protein STEHIDRAFT_171174 [Stereum hirsutum FP-91666 SS1]EIM83073.1 hypothetical protein STEHIDRAFT_171174 [Stereum hirsutum FP-91666 SS1]
MLSSRPLSIHIDNPSEYGQTKTPGRAHHTGRKENAVRYGGGKSNNGKHYKASLQTPARDDSIKPQTLLKEGQSKLTTTISRPLGDKTPFHRNDTKPRLDFAPLGPEKLDAVNFGDIVPGEALLRPSSTRKSIRGRRSSAGGTTLDFTNLKTPFTKGNHWDVSDLDIPADVAEAEGEVEAVEQEDYDEVEYMPPTAVESPYEPTFPMPDYKITGAALWSAMHSYQEDDAADVFHLEQSKFHEASLDVTVPASQFEMLPLRELVDDDDPFALPRSTKSSSTSITSHASKASLRQTIASKSMTRPTTTRPTIPTQTRSVTTATSRSTPAISKPRTIPTGSAFTSGHARSSSRPTATTIPRPGTSIGTTRSTAKTTAPVRAASVAAIKRTATSTAARTAPPVRSATTTNIGIRKPLAKERPGAAIASGPSTSRASTLIKRVPTEELVLDFDDAMVGIDGHGDDFQFDV